VAARAFTSLPGAAQAVQVTGVIGVAEILLLSE
jgi:hypothetical protein